MLQPVAVAVTALAAAACTVRSAVLVLAGSGRGLDPTDEASYLLAMVHRQPANGFNGLSGYYTGLLLRLVGNDLTRLRIAGVVLFVLAFGGLGHAIARLLLPSGASGPWTERGLRSVVSLGSVAGGLLYYSLFIRTPSYNWLALLGAAVALHGLVRALDLRVTGASAWGTAALLAGGCFLAVWGKSTTGAIMIALCAVVVLVGVPTSVRARVGLLLRTASMGVVLLIAHFAFVLGPSDTIAGYRRVSHTLAAVDPAYYAPRSLVQLTLSQLGEVPEMVWRAMGPLWGLLLLPLVAFVLPRSVRSSAVRWLTAAAAGVMCLALLAGGGWVGGLKGYSGSAVYGLAVLLPALCGFAVSKMVDREQPSRRGGTSGRLVVALALVVAAAAYAFGSDNGITAQLTGAVGLILLAAAVLAAGAGPGSTLTSGGRARLWAAAAVAVVVCGIASSILGDARVAPFRVAPLAANTVPLDIGRYGGTVDVDPATADEFDRLERTAREQGWQAGTPLLDLSGTPAVCMVLDADAPKAVLPLVGSFPTGTQSSLVALRYETAAWFSHAWLVVDPTAPKVDVPAVLAAHGRTLTRDYVYVTTVPRPLVGGTLVLYRPRRS